MGIHDSTDDDSTNLENIVIFMMFDITVNIEESDIETYHRFGKHA